MGIFFIEVLAEDAPVIAAKLKKSQRLNGIRHFTYCNAPKFGRVELTSGASLAQIEEWLMQHPGVPDFFDVKES